MSNISREIQILRKYQRNASDKKHCPKLLFCLGHLLEKSISVCQRTLIAMCGVAFVIMQSNMQSWMGVPDCTAQLKIHGFPLPQWYSNGALRRSPHRDLSGDRKGGWAQATCCLHPAPSPLSTIPSIRACYSVFYL